MTPDTETAQFNAAFTRGPLLGDDENMPDPDTDYPGWRQWQANKKRQARERHDDWLCHKERDGE